MIPISNDLNAFLSFDDTIAPNNDIIELTSKLIGHIENQTEQARILFEWVRDQIPHSKDINSQEVTCTAIEVLNKRTGICFAKSHLLASMMRHAKIPTGFCYQIFENLENPNDGKRSLHGLNAIYLQETQSWHRLDPRGNHGDINAQFSTTEESLAFPELEFLDNYIYASPLANVVQSLQNATSINALWPALPTAEAQGLTD